MNSADKSDATSEKINKSEPCIDYHPNDRFCIQENKKTDNNASENEENMEVSAKDDSDSADEPEINGSDESSVHKSDEVEPSKVEEKVTLVNGSNEDSIESDKPCKKETPAETNHKEEDSKGSDEDDDDDDDLADDETNHKEEEESKSSEDLGNDEASMEKMDTSVEEVGRKNKEKMNTSVEEADDAKSDMMDTSVEVIDDVKIGKMDTSLEVVDDSKSGKMDTNLDDDSKNGKMDTSLEVVDDAKSGKLDTSVEVIGVKKEEDASIEETVEKETEKAEKNSTSEVKKEAASSNEDNDDDDTEKVSQEKVKEPAADVKPTEKRTSPRKKSLDSLNRNSVEIVKLKSGDSKAENKSLSLIVDKLKNSAAAQGSDAQGSTDNSLAFINKTLNAKGLQLTKIDKAEPKSPTPVYLDGPDCVSDEILESAKFPAFLKGVIEIGNFLSLPIPCSADFKLRDGEALLESPSLISPLLLKKPDKVLVEDPENSKKSVWDAKPFFNSSAGEFLIGIGLSRAKEWYERDQVRLKKKQLRKEGKLLERESELSQAQATYLRTKQANEPFIFDTKRCEFCDFKTESSTVMDGHYLIPHLTPRREYRCNFCTFLTRDHKAILFHMEALHGKKGVLDLLGPFFYDCPFCMFETNLKTKATSHINKCQKYFLPARNQAPPGDWDHPSVTAKPITRADIKSYEMCVAAATASTATRGGRGGIHKGFAPKTIRPRGSYMVSPRPSVPLYQHLATSTLKDSVNYRALTPQGSNFAPRPRYTDMIAHLRSTKPEISVVSGGQIYQVVSNSGQVVPVITTTTLNASASQLILSSSNQGPQPVALFPNLASGSSSRSSSSSHQGTPRMANTIQNKQLPRLQGPYNTPTTRPSGTNPAAANTSFVICEICDGYLKDLEQLRTHMLWIHKVKIHPKMLASRPPLNCQKCQWRFFTDQGLERHLLGAHGLVTSNMQELSNKNQDGGRCTICGRVYVCKLVSHMNQVHKIALKPAHLSYKCTVCTATFNLYKLFETHVYMFHSGSVKRPAEDASSDPPKKKFQSVRAAELSKSRPGPASKTGKTEKKKLGEDENKTEILAADEDDATEEPPGEAEVRVLDYEVCFYCGIKARKLLTHMKVRHTRKCCVKMCRIEKCERCLCSFDGMVVLHTADFESDSEVEEPEEISVVSIS